MSSEISLNEEVELLEKLQEERAGAVAAHSYRVQELINKQAEAQAQVDRSFEDRMSLVQFATSEAERRKMIAEARQKSQRMNAVVQKLGAVRRKQIEDWNAEHQKELERIDAEIDRQGEIVTEAKRLRDSLK